VSREDGKIADPRFLGGKEGGCNRGGRGFKADRQEDHLFVRVVEAGRRTEYEAIFGYAVREAEKTGVEMPSTRYVYQFLKGMNEFLG
jgi:hypothetical protein